MYGFSSNYTWHLAFNLLTLVNNVSKQYIQDKI